MKRVLPVAMLCFALATAVSAQKSLLAEIDGLETGYVNKLLALDDGFLLLHSSKGSLVGSGRRDLIVSRFDECYEEIWTKVYSGTSINLDLVDVEKTDGGDVLVLLRTGLKHPALLKMDPGGNVQFLKTYERSIHDFTYSLAYLDGQAMIFGAVTIPAVNDTRNYIIMTDEEGDIIWSKQYIWNERASQAAILGDGSFICKSGSYLYRLNASGEIDWVQQYENAYISETAPLPYKGGFVIRIEKEDEHILSLLEYNGQHRWDSELLTTRSTVPAMLERNGDLMLISTDQEYPAILKFNAGGAIISNRRFDLEIFNHFGFPDAAITGDSTLVISSNHTLDLNDFSDLLMVNPGLMDCLPPKGSVETRTNHDPLVYFDRTADFAAEDIVFSEEGRTYNASDLVARAYRLKCEQNEAVGKIIDTTLACNETFLFDNPHPGFIYTWSDGLTDSVRQFVKSGNYQVTVENCVHTYEYDILISAVPCPCRVFVPTAFSPNGDGINDELQIFNECEFNSFHLQIYDRWGAKVFESRDPLQRWNAIFKGKRLATGYYIYEMDYSTGYGAENDNVRLTGGVFLISHSTH